MITAVNDSVLVDANRVSAVWIDGQVDAVCIRVDGETIQLKPPRVPGVPICDVLQAELTRISAIVGVA